MYLADYHTHSTCSGDGKNTMTEMAQAGIAAGLDEICLTDHMDIVNWQAQQGAGTFLAGCCCTIYAGM